MCTLRVVRQSYIHKGSNIFCFFLVIIVMLYGEAMDVDSFARVEKKSSLNQAFLRIVAHRQTSSFDNAFRNVGDNNVVRRGDGC